MANLPENFNFNVSDKLTAEDLVFQLQRMYTTLARSINLKPDLFQREQDGQSNDADLANGSINLNTLTNKVEMLTNHLTPTTVTWTTLS